MIVSGLRVADGGIDLSLWRGVKRAFSGFVFTHAFSFDLQSVGVVNDAVEDGVGQRWIADNLVPLLNRNLTGDQNRGALVAILEDLEEVALLGLGELGQAPVIQN